MRPQQRGDLSICPQPPHPQYHLPIHLTKAINTSNRRQTSRIKDIFDLYLADSATPEHVHQNGTFSPIQSTCTLIFLTTHSQTAIFNFQSLLMVLLLAICTSTYLHTLASGIMDRNKNGAFGIFWKLARVGERLSPYVSLCCLFMAVSLVA
jgi:hypothetical protein